MSWLKNLNKFLARLTGLLILIMVIAVVREVVGRYLFRNPTEWGMELNENLLIGVVFLGAAYLFQIGGHVKVDFLYNHFRGALRMVADIIANTFVIAYCAVLVWFGWDMTVQAFVMQTKSAEAMRWLLYPTYALIPVGSFLLAVYALTNILRVIVIGRNAND